MGLKPKYNPALNAPRKRLSNLEGRTAHDIVDAAKAIKNDEWSKKHRRREAGLRAKQKADVAAVSLAVMPWNSE